MTLNKAVLLSAVAALAAGPAFAEEPARKLDLRKSDIESPLKQTLADLAAAERLREATARLAEAPNPKVPPGAVKWHPDLAAACEAARKSGKPVLLFQMLGKLDDQFC
jgi:hypothetical protein